MSFNKRNLIPERMDIEIAITILLCLAVSHLANLVGLKIEALAVTTGAVMCVQDSTKNAWTTSLIRMIGVVCGGLVGVAIVALDNVIGIEYVFYLMICVGIVVNLVICKQFRMIYVQARVSCISLLLVVMVFEGVDRFEYAIGRLVGGLVGALVALFVSMVFSALIPRRNKES